MSLIQLHTKPGTNDKMARVVLEADGVLFDRLDSHPHIFAFSAAGPEEAIRAISGGCAMTQKDGKAAMYVDCLSNGVCVQNGGWAGKWDCRVIKLKDGPHHIVAWCNEMRTPGRDAITKHPVIFPATVTEADIHAALYACLLRDFTTPLIPTGVVGQPPNEAEVGRTWRRVLCNAIIANTDWWHRLRHHPGGTNFWPGAAVLRLDQPKLDELVSRFVGKKILTIPAEAEREPAAVAG